MNGGPRPRYRRQQRDRPACGGTGLGRGRHKDNVCISEGAESGRVSTRALVALGAYVAQDLRDRDGVTRPLLRRAALRFVTSRHVAVHRLGDAYLRRDPAAPEEMAAAPEVASRLLLPSGRSQSGTGTPGSPESPAGAV
jgi:hypothetical protein